MRGQNPYGVLFNNQQQGNQSQKENLKGMVSRDWDWLRRILCNNQRNWNHSEKEELKEIEILIRNFAPDKELLSFQSFLHQEESREFDYALKTTYSILNKFKKSQLFYFHCKHNIVLRKDFSSVTI